MDQYIFVFFAIAYIAVLVWGIVKHKKTASAILFVVILALIYDNTILAFGHLIGEGELLKALNYGRFLLHAVFTPLLILFSFFVLKEANIRFAQKAWVMYVFSGLTVVAMVAEYFFQLKHLTLKVEKAYGVVSYTSAESATGPPIMILLVVAAILVAGIILAWKRKWWWMVIGTVVMGVGSALSLLVESNAIPNLLELTLIVSLMLTAIHFSKIAQSKSRNDFTKG